MVVVVETEKKEQVMAEHARYTRGRQGGRKGSPLFKKGCKPGPGRPKGMPNAMTRILKEAILMAGEDVGNKRADEAKQERKGLVSYLEWVAIKHPPAYVQLLARVMSTQIETSTKQSEPYKTVEELQQALRDRGLPVERIYPMLEFAPIKRDDVEMPE